jgi:hypothetical protein
MTTPALSQTHPNAEPNELTARDVCDTEAERKAIWHNARRNAKEEAR